MASMDWVPGLVFVFHRLRSGWELMTMNGELRATNSQSLLIRASITISLLNLMHSQSESTEYKPLSGPSQYT